MPDRRKDRLIAWRKQRTGSTSGGGGGDLVVNWIDREVIALSSYKPPVTPLMAVSLTRTDVRSSVRHEEEEQRLVRLGWLLGLGGVETLTVDDLRAAIEFRGRLRPDDPAWIDSLLPLYPEPEERWRRRRAATEVALESELRLVHFRQLFIPETGPGSNPDVQNPTELIDSVPGRDTFGSINGISPFAAEAVQLKLDDAAARGRIGMVITRLEFSVDSDETEAETNFWVRQEGGFWSVASTHSATARVGERMAPNEPVYPNSAALRTSLLIIESWSSTPFPPAVSARRQTVGATAERALGRARFALDREIAPLHPVVEKGLALSRRIPIARENAYLNGAPRYPSTSIPRWVTESVWDLGSKGGLSDCGRVLRRIPIRSMRIFDIGSSP